MRIFHSLKSVPSVDNIVLEKHSLAFKETVGAPQVWRPGWVSLKMGHCVQAGRGPGHRQTQCAVSWVRCVRFGHPKALVRPALWVLGRAAVSSQETVFGEWLCHLDRFHPTPSPLFLVTKCLGGTRCWGLVRKIQQLQESAGRKMAR